MTTLVVMKVVGVKRLKARLSEYVRLVKAGETILVTDRDEVVAEIRPARRQRGLGEDLEEILDGQGARIAGRHCLKAAGRGPDERLREAAGGD